MLTIEDIQKLERRGRLRPLVKALESVHEATDTRAAAAAALGRIGGDKAVEPLAIVAREAREWPLVDAALQSLGTIGTTAAVHALVDATPFVHRKHGQRATILTVLATTLRIRRAQLGPLEAWLGSPQSWDTFSLVVDVLGEVGGSQAITLLKSCLYDAEGRIRTRSPTPSTPSTGPSASRRPPSPTMSPSSAGSTAPASAPPASRHS